MLVVALAFAVLEIGGSASEVGLVLAAGTLPLVATVLVGGVVADRVPRRDVMVAAGTVLSAIGVGALVGSIVATRVDPGRPLVVVALTEGLFALPSHSSPAARTSRYSPAGRSSPAPG
jgi:MFS family permease